MRAWIFTIDGCGDVEWTPDGENFATVNSEGVVGIFTGDSLDKARKDAIESVLDGFSDEEIISIAGGKEGDGNDEEKMRDHEEAVRDKIEDSLNWLEIDLKGQSSTYVAS